MNELYCIHCQSKKIDRLSNGEYCCEGCHLIFNAVQFKDYLVVKVSEAEKMADQNMCGRCGRKLGDPNWCSWCGSDPLSPEDVIRELNDQIQAIDQIIAAGEPEEYRKARAGDIQAISNVFQRARGRGPYWKSLIDLGSAAVPFLINTFKHIDTYRQASDAEKALIEIGDQRAIEPLVEALLTINNPTILAQLNTQWSDQAPQYFSKLLIKLNEISTFTRSDDARRRLVFNMVESLKAIMDHAASQLLDNDILAASALNDISVVVTKFDMSTELHDEDPWGPVTYHPSYEVQETIDCSSLREAALKEIKRRGLD